MINHRLSGRKFRIKQILMIKKNRLGRDQYDYFRETDLFEDYNASHDLVEQDFR